MLSSLLSLSNWNTYGIKDKLGFKQEHVDGRAHTIWTLLIRKVNKEN